MRKTLSLFLVDIFLFFAASFAAFQIIFPQQPFFVTISPWLESLFLCRILFFICSNLYRWDFGFAHLAEWLSLFGATLGATISVFAVAFFAGESGLWRFFCVEFLVCLLFVSGFRFGKRFPLVLFRKKPLQFRKTLIVGAGEAGESLVKEMQRHFQSGYFPVAFVDDDPAKKGRKIRGLSVLGGSENIPQIVEKKGIEQIVIALPSASGDSVRKIIDFSQQARVQVKILPGVWEIILGEAHLSQLREIRPEDLLGRETIQTDSNRIQNFFNGKTVLVTGACGSIGSEMIAKLSQFSLRKIVAVDWNENEIYFLKHKNYETEKNNLEPVLADITDMASMEIIFKQFRPQIVFHAAAFKHVSLMEEFPAKAIHNNVGGTRMLAELSIRYGVRHFGLISTDKAVQPQSVMGRTKHLAEQMMEFYNRQKSTCFFSVRFGNVLGSNGSIIPILRKQILKGGPVTITSPDAKRYFMTVSEAVQLILQASVQAQGGEIFVLDMGQQVLIEHLAKQLIRMMGKIPGKDIAIQYIGLRPGEKLEEALFESRGDYHATAHEKILVKQKGVESLPPDFEFKILQLIKAAGDEEEGRELILQLLKDYFQPANGSAGVSKN